MRGSRCATVSASTESHAERVQTFDSAVNRRVAWLVGGSFPTGFPGAFQRAKMMQARPNESVGECSFGGNASGESTEGEDSVFLQPRQPRRPTHSLGGLGTISRRSTFPSAKGEFLWACNPGSSRVIRHWKRA
jgi:hypothetical protein